MSQTQTREPGETSSQREDQSSPYPRDNYFASISGEYDTDREPRDPTTHEHGKDAFQSDDDKNEWIARSILSDDATMLCPITLHEDPDHCPHECETYLEEGECEHESLNLHVENESVELTEPEVYPPSKGNSYTPDTPQQKKVSSNSQWRVNEEHGYLVFGGVIQDRPEDELLEAVDDAILSMDATFLASEVEEARELARRLKRGGDHRDVDIMRKVISKLIGFQDG